MPNLSDLNPNTPLFMPDLISLFLNKNDYSTAEYKRILKWLHKINQNHKILFRAKPTKKGRLYTTPYALAKANIGFFSEEGNLALENIALRKRVAELEAEIKKITSLLR